MNYIDEKKYNTFLKKYISIKEQKVFECNILKKELEKTKKNTCKEKYLKKKIIKELVAIKGLEEFISTIMVINCPMQELEKNDINLKKNDDLSFGEILEKISINIYEKNELNLKLKEVKHKLKYLRKEEIQLRKQYNKSIKGA